MKEIKDIISAFDLAQKERKDCALATVVHVDGSSYRRPGARMLIDSDGRLTGAISGGCLEGDALRKAQLVMIEKKPLLVTYDTNDEDDARLGLGLGCNGIIHVLIEPVNNDDLLNPLALLKTLISKRQQAVLISVFSLHDKKMEQPGTRVLLLEDGSYSGHASPLEEHILSEARACMITQSSSFKTFNNAAFPYTAFMQYIAPAVSLVILGAGNDVKPLLELANVLGWETTIIDGRPKYATRERFPSATNIYVRKPERILDGLAVDPQTIFLLMTHNYNYDIAALRVLVKRDVVYVGMLGPRKKLERMLIDLKENDTDLTSQQATVIHTPAGLDIGAESPEEIALSIIAEIKSVLSGRKGGSLSASAGEIHPRHSGATK